MKLRLVVPQLLALLLSFSLLTCGQKQDDQKQSIPAQSDLKEIRAKIAQIGMKMQQAVLENDFATQLAFLADDIVIDSPMEPPVRGKTAVQEQEARAQKEGIRYRSFSGTTEDLWVCGERVYERGTWGMSFTTNTMKKPFAAYGSYFEIWTKDASGGYRIQYLVYTFDMNPYEAGG